MIRKLGRKCYSAGADRWAKRRVVRKLSRLDDHMLRDIGLTRSQIGNAPNLTNRPMW
jgi:uncharacterized protein YjiS (DUF1127 family)